MLKTRKWKIWPQKLRQTCQHHSEWRRRGRAIIPLWWTWLEQKILRLRNRSWWSQRFSWKDIIYTTNYNRFQSQLSNQAASKSLKTSSGTRSRQSTTLRVSSLIMASAALVVVDLQAHHQAHHLVDIINPSHRRSCERTLETAQRSSWMKLMIA